MQLAEPASCAALDGVLLSGMPAQQNVRYTTDIDIKLEVGREGVRSTGVVQSKRIN